MRFQSLRGFRGDRDATLPPDVAQYLPRKFQSLRGFRGDRELFATGMISPMLFTFQSLRGFRGDRDVWNGTDWVPIATVSIPERV